MIFLKVKLKLNIKWFTPMEKLKMSSNILDKIISISGKPGLFKLISQTRNGVIVVYYG